MILGDHVPGNWPDQIALRDVRFTDAAEWFALMSSHGHLAAIFRCPPGRAPELMTFDEENHRVASNGPRVLGQWLSPFFPKQRRYDLRVFGPRANSKRRTSPKCL